jgi:hypothetical protein
MFRMRKLPSTFDLILQYRVVLRPTWCDSCVPIFYSVPWQNVEEISFLATRPPPAPRVDNLICDVITLLMISTAFSV